MKTEIKTPMFSISTGGSRAPEQATPISRDNGDNIDQRIADLEARPRMPAQGTGIDGDVLVLDGPSPRWGQGGIPAITGGEEEHMSLVLVDNGGTLEPQWQYDILQA